MVPGAKSSKSVMAAPVCWVVGHDIHGIPEIWYIMVNHGASGKCNLSKPFAVNLVVPCCTNLGKLRSQEIDCLAH